MDTTNIILIVALLAMFVLGVYVIPQWRFKRSVRQVLSIFRHFGATRPDGAKALEEMGLNVQRTFVQTMLRGRDYKGYAIAAMVKANIVVQREDGRFYLVEEKLPQSFRQTSPELPPA